MKLYKALDIGAEDNQLVSLIGGGGKTTAMFKLAREMKSIGKRVLLTTTTAIFKPQPEEYDIMFLMHENAGRFEMDEINEGSITVIGSKISEEGKLLGIQKEIINEFYKQSIFDIIIVEADGSRRKPIKAPDIHEPVIPKATTKTVGVIGLDSLDKEITLDNVHRHEIFAKVTESHVMDRIDEKIIYRLITDCEGLFKGTPNLSKKYLLLNKVEEERREEASVAICNMLLDSNINLDGMLICSFNNDKIARYDK